NDVTIEKVASLLASRIRKLGIDELRGRWRSMTHCNAPKALSRDLLARLIAHRLQEEHIGKLDRALCQMLDRLAKGEQPVRRLKIGTVLGLELVRHAGVIDITPALVPRARVPTPISEITTHVSGFVAGMDLRGSFRSAVASNAS